MYNLLYVYSFFFPSMPHARTCHIPLAFWNTPPSLPTRFCFSKRFVTLAPFSPSFSLSIGDFYLPLVLLGTDHRRWTQWGTPARSGSEKKKKWKKKEEEKGCLANLWELTRPASSVYVCTRTYVGYACSCLCVCVYIYVYVYACVFTYARVSVCV